MPFSSGAVVLLCVQNSCQTSMKNVCKMPVKTLVFTQDLHRKLMVLLPYYLMKYD